MKLLRTFGLTFALAAALALAASGASANCTFATVRDGGEIGNARFTNFKHAAQGFTLCHPKEWIARERVEGVTVLEPRNVTGQPTATIQITRETLPGVTRPQDLVERMRQAYPGAQVRGTQLEGGPAALVESPSETVIAILAAPNQAVVARSRAPQGTRDAKLTLTTLKIAP